MKPNIDHSGTGHSRMPCDTYTSSPWEGVSGGGASQLSDRPNLPNGPGLTVIETLSLHDGEPMHWWEWSSSPLARREAKLRLLSGPGEGGRGSVQRSSLVSVSKKDAESLREAAHEDNAPDCAGGPGAHLRGLAGLAQMVQAGRKASPSPTREESETVVKVQG